MGPKRAYNLPGYPHREFFPAHFRLRASRGPAQFTVD